MTSDPSTETRAAPSDGPAPQPTVWPTLRARDARALIRFLVHAFGFEEAAVYGDGDLVEHAQLSWPPGGGIMLGSARNRPDDPWPIQPGTSGCYVVTDDIDAVLARARAAGAEIRGPFDTEYGSREFTARDPEGNLWQFGSYRGEPRRR